MKNKTLNLPTRALMSTLALAAAMTALPLTVLASGAESAITQTDASRGQLKGTVVDSNGEPVIGASVKVVGQNGLGTMTDIDGNFTLQVKSQGTVEISYIGFVAQKLKFRPGQVLNVRLEEDSQTLDELIVVGFGTQKKVNLTGAVSVIGSKDLAQRPVQSAATALQGLVPGLQINQSSGAMESSPSINVRGIGTIGQGSKGDPLILIDGAEGDINTLNSQDIESVSVLKDAAASSIYGSRAPFGVILITTKKGKKGKVSVNYNNSFRFSDLIREKQMMNSVDFSSWMNDLTGAEGGSPFITDQRMSQIVEYHNAKPYSPGVRQRADGTFIYAAQKNPNNTQYWDDGYEYGIDDVQIYDVVYKDRSFAMEHNASISGAGEKVNYYASLNYLDNDGFMKLADDRYKRYNATAKIGADLAKWIKMNYSMRFVCTDYERPSYMTESLYNDMSRQGWPMLPLYDPNGHLWSSPSPALPLRDGGKSRTQSDITTHQLGFVIEPVKNWKTHLDFTYRISNNDSHEDIRTTYVYDVDNNPYINTHNHGSFSGSSSVSESNNKENYFNFQAYTEYGFDLGQKHNFNVMAGFQAEQLKQRYFFAQRNGILDNNHPEIDITTGLSYDGKMVTPSVSGRRNQWQTAGFFGRLNYNYDERYLAELNIRHDGSSRFRRDQMWRTFPSLSIGWNIANENFFADLKKTVGLLKLRASYGSLGNQNTSSWYLTYQTLNYSALAGYWLQDGLKPNVVYAPSLVSTKLTWEKIESYDIGLDFGFFDNRLTGSFDWYVRNTKDMVGNAPELPAFLGADVPVTNNTDLRTSGWELQVSWRDVLENGFGYGVSFNLSDARTKITRYPNNPTNSLSNYIAGRYMNEIWGYETIGIAKTDEEMNEHLAHTDQTALGSNWKAGDIMYRDINGDGKVSNGYNTLNDPGDLKVIGNSTPRYLIGLDLNASWKGFDVRAFFQGMLKRDVWVGGAYQFGVDGGGRWFSIGLEDTQDYFRNADSWSVKNGYRSENLDAWLPRPVEYSWKNMQTQTRYLLSAAYLRLKNLQVGYTIPRNLVEKYGLSNVRVFFSAENLATFTSLPEHLDPETIGTSGSNNNGYPLSRTLSFGLNVSF